jgi:catechol 2,3-dioxygenase-like lactoylglutathione lyase family enzyme
MLERTDRLALAVPGADEAAATYQRIFDTVIVGDEQDAEANARRVTLQWGRDQLELFQPTGPGPVADFLASGRRGLFAGGFSAPDPGVIAARLERAGVRVHQQSADRFVVFQHDLDGTGIIISKTASHQRVGLADRIWQITFAVQDLEAAIGRYSQLLGLEDVFTNRYQSELYGYDGAITWFDARRGGRLDSLEYIQPTDPAKAAGRFVAKNGNGIYMASIETNDIPAIRERITSTGPGWDPTDFGGFIHPLRLHGLLLALVTYEDWDSRRPLP